MKKLLIIIICSSLFLGCSTNNPLNSNSSQSKWQATFDGVNYSWSGIWPDDFSGNSANEGRATCDFSLPTTVGEIILENGQVNHVELYFNFNGRAITQGSYINGNAPSVTFVGPLSGGGLYWMSNANENCIVNVYITEIANNLVKGTFSGTVMYQSFTSGSIMKKQINGSFETTII